MLNQQDAFQRFSEFIVIMIVAVMILALPNNLYCSPSTLIVSLEGIHKFKAGDNYDWANSSLDDTLWQSIKIPESWQSQGIQSEKGMGWYRIHFSVPPQFDQIQFALILGRIGNAEEVFLNGTKIGSEGFQGNRFFDMGLKERFYKIPRDLMKKENVLAVRVLNIYSNGGIYCGPVFVGEYYHLFSDKLGRDMKRVIIESCIISLLTIFFITCLFFYINEKFERQYLYFGLFVLISGVAYVFESFIYYESGLKTPFIQNIACALYGLIPPCLVLFADSLYPQENRSKVNFFIFISIPYSVVLLFYTTHNYSFFFILNILWYIEIIVIGLFGIYIIFKAYLDRRHEAGPLFIGSLGIFLSAIFDLYPYNFLFIFFLGCILYALTVRFTRIKRSMVTLTGKILTAHEEERKRLSRDLHDGLGQSLLTLKLNLQRINHEKNDPRIVEAIGQLSESINELRTISTGLRPAFLDEIGLKAAMESYGQKFADQTGISLHMEINSPNRKTATIEDNIFRIFQEAMSNIAKHSKANHITVTLRQSGDLLILRIKDNGIGFDSRESASNNLGIGLSTIRERVSLLHGTMSIKSHKNIGSLISIEVPVR